VSSDVSIIVAIIWKSGRPLGSVQLAPSSSERCIDALALATSSTSALLANSGASART
jgi:hypothetical protein